ncbi:MAG: ExeA family protein [Desulfococcaceae bacterium]
MELSIQMRRGLNVVMGDVGTGKTTLCRELLRRLSKEREMAVHLLLDPGFRNAAEALRAVMDCLAPQAPLPEGELARKEAIRSALFAQGVDQGKTVVLIIDEGQKISPFFLEILREFLNFETNRHKLLQIVIFAQPELERRLAEQANVLDRVGFLYRLTPLSRREVREMIDFRLRRAGATGGAEVFFPPMALWAVWRLSRGYPRRIVDLCHQCLVALILEDRAEVTPWMVRSQARRGRFSRMNDRLASGRWWSRAALAGLLAGVGVLAFLEFRGGSMAETANRLPAIPSATTKPAALEPGPVSAGAEPGPSTGRAVAMGPVLGAVAMAAGETIGELAALIYGTARPEIIQAVLAANPHIRGPQRIGVGERVQFPTILQSSEGFLPSVYIQVARFPALEPAVAAFRSLQGRGDPPPMRLLSCWDPDDGPQFVLVPDRAFPDPEAAETWLRRFRAEFPLPGTVYAEWTPGTLLFGEGFEEAAAGEREPEESREEPA